MEKKFRTLGEDGYIYFDLYSVSGLSPEQIDKAEIYTGENDKNNKEIYENAKVKLRGNVSFISYYKGAFCIGKKKRPVLYYEWCKMEVLEEK